MMPITTQQTNRKQTPPQDRAAKVGIQKLELNSYTLPSFLDKYIRLIFFFFVAVGETSYLKKNIDSFEMDQHFSFHVLRCTMISAQGAVLETALTMLTMGAQP